MKVIIIYQLLLQIFAYKLIGNYSQGYYLIELTDKQNITNLIIDQNLDKAYINCSDYQKNITLGNIDKTYAQRFNSIIGITAINETLKLTNQTEITLVCLIQSSYDLQYGYLGLKSFIGNNLNSSLQICISNQGGFINFLDAYSVENQVTIDYLLNSLNEINIELISIYVESLQIVSNNYLSQYEIVIDISYIYIDVPESIFYQLENGLLCNGVFCPQRNDMEGLICYNKGDMDINTFLKKFNQLEFEFPYGSLFWYPKDYFISLNNQIFCLPIRKGINKIILGQPFLKNKELIFSRQQIQVFYKNCDEETQERYQLPFNERTQGLNMYILGGCFTVIIIILAILLKSQQRKLFNPYIFIFCIQITYPLTYKNGEYYLSLQTQNQEYELVADTGAYMTMFECKNITSNLNKCKECSFSSSTYDGSFYQGEYYTMNFTYNNQDVNLTIKNITVGCVQSFQGKYVGILGLAPQSSDIYNTFVEQVIDYNLLEKYKLFSIYLGQSSGSLTILQDIDTQINNSSQLITYNSNSLYYEVELLSIQDNKGNLLYQMQENISVIIDSGSTLINVYPELLMQIEKSFNNCKSDLSGCPQKLNNVYQNCYQYNQLQYSTLQDFFQTFPQFHFNFANNYTYTIFSEDYLINYGNNIYCLPFGGHTRNYESRYQKIILLGQPFMRMNLFTFNLSNKTISITQIKDNKNNNNIIIRIIQIIIGIIIIFLLPFIIIQYCFSFRQQIQQQNTQIGYNPYI